MYMSEPITKIVIEEKKELKAGLSNTEEQLEQEQLEQIADDLLDTLLEMTYDSDIDIGREDELWLFSYFKAGNLGLEQESVNFKLHIPIYFPEDREEGLEVVAKILQILLERNADGQQTNFKVVMPDMQKAHLSGTQAYKGMTIYPNTIQNGRRTNISEAVRLAQNISSIVMQYPHMASRQIENGLFIWPGVSLRYGEMDEYARHTGKLPSNHRKLPFWQVFDTRFRGAYSNLFSQIRDELGENGIVE